MKDVHDYFDHVLFSKIEEHIACLVKMMDHHHYNDKSFFVAQLFIIDELIDIETKLRKMKADIGNLKKQAAENAIEDIEKNGFVTKVTKKNNNKLYQEAEDLEFSKKALQYGRYLLRYIGDGIAWRLFNYNRRLIRALASKEPVPAVADHENIQSIKLIFRGIRKLGRNWLPLLHDLTNCLRTSDLSIFRDGQIYRIEELKIKTGSRDKVESSNVNVYRDSRSIRQEERIKNIRKFMESRQLGDLYPELAGGESIQADLIEKHNFKHISNALEQVRGDGFGFISPEPGLLYLACDDYKNKSEELLIKAQKKYPNIFSSLFTSRSFTGMHESRHQGVPITAMSLPADDILDLIFGRIGIITVINFEELKIYFMEREFTLLVNNEVNSEYFLRVKKDDKIADIREGVWNRVMFEALSIETLFDMTKYIIDDHLDSLTISAT